MKLKKTKESFTMNKSKFNDSSFLNSMEEKSLEKRKKI